MRMPSGGRASTATAARRQPALTGASRELTDRCDRWSEVVVPPVMVVMVMVMVTPAVMVPPVVMVVAPAMMAMAPASVMVMVPAVIAVLREVDEAHVANRGQAGPGEQG